MSPLGTTHLSAEPRLSIIFSSAVLMQLVSKIDVERRKGRRNWKEEEEEEKEFEGGGGGGEMG